MRCRGPAERAPHQPLEYPGRSTCNLAKDPIQRRSSLSIESFQSIVLQIQLLEVLTLARISRKAPAWRSISVSNPERAISAAGHHLDHRFGSFQSTYQPSTLPLSIPTIRNSSRGYALDSQHPQHPASLPTAALLHPSLQPAWVSGTTGSALLLPAAPPNMGNRVLQIAPRPLSSPPAHHEAMAPPLVPAHAPALSPKCAASSENYMTICAHTPSKSSCWS